MAEDFQKLPAFSLPLQAAKTFLTTAFGPTFASLCDETL
jgi:hypothetical protein